MRHVVVVVVAVNGEERISSFCRRSVQWRKVLGRWRSTLGLTFGELLFICCIQHNLRPVVGNLCVPHHHTCRVRHRLQSATSASVGLKTGAGSNEDASGDHWDFQEQK